MAFTHQLTKSYKNAKGETETVTVSATASGERNFSDTFATGVTDGEIAITCDRSQAKAISLSSTQNVTLETNATDHTGGDSIALTANVPVMWELATDTITNCPFTVDVTKIYVTNSSGATATVKIQILEEMKL